MLGSGICCSMRRILIKKKEKSCFFKHQIFKKRKRKEKKEKEKKRKEERRGKNVKAYDVRGEQEQPF